MLNRWNFLKTGFYEGIKLRLDGFVSVDAGDDTGTLVTKPFGCDGGPLTINASAKGGMVGVAVLDEDGIQYQGYSRQECALFDGDSLGHRVTWREKLSLEELKGKNVRPQVLSQEREAVRLHGWLG